ncbi:Cryptochrome-2 [Armadillidium vulgare]|nr:Cryptochrome-2 [Armadillidium vulgare]
MTGTSLKGKPKHVVHWFRKGLRIHDNPSLRLGLKNSTTFRCIFILDPWFAGSSNVGINRWRFLLQSLEDLDRSLRKFNSRLFVIRGQPAKALPDIFREWGTNILTFEEDPEPFGKARDANIIAMAREMGIKVIVRTSHTLYKLDRIIEKNGGKPPLTYKSFQNILSQIGPPPLPDPAITPEEINGGVSPISEDHDDKYGVPTLEDLGFDTDHLQAPVWKGGEIEALERLEHHLERKAWVASFGKPKMTPQSLYASPTGLSPYLRFGCLSARQFFLKLNDLFQKGQTGYPWIDAIMTQLRQEGWVHNVARHAVALFSYKRRSLGVVFDELLLDADWAVNAGSWMWLSCSSFFQQFFHCYCPVRYGRKADPNGDYIRTYLPILKNFPTKYIHEPWTAPESIQRAAKCIIGKDYPMPMVDHIKQSQHNIERMKQVYQQLTHYRGSINSGSKSGKENSNLFPPSSDFEKIHQRRKMKDFKRETNQTVSIHA